MIFVWDLLGIEKSIILILILLYISSALFFEILKLKRQTYWQSLNSNQKKWTTIGYICSLTPSFLMIIIISGIFPLFTLLTLINYLAITENTIGILILIISLLMVWILLVKYRYIDKIIRYVLYPYDVWFDSLKTIGVNMNLRFNEGEN